MEQSQTTQLSYDPVEYEGVGITREIRQQDTDFITRVFVPDCLPPIVKDEFFGFIQVENSLTDFDKNSTQSSRYNLKLIQSRILFFMGRGRVTPKVLNALSNMENLYLAKLGNAFDGIAWRRMNTRISNVITERPQGASQQQTGFIQSLKRRFGGV